MIYAVQAGIGGPIKFGKSSHPFHRVVALQRQCNLFLIRLAAGPITKGNNEYDIHHRLDAFRMPTAVWGREWYMPFDEVWSEVKRLGPFPGDMYHYHYRLGPRPAKQSSIAI